MAHFTEMERAKAWDYAYQRADAFCSRRQSPQGGWLDVDRFRDAVRRALQNAEASWDPQQGASWQSWAFYAVSFAIRREYARQSRWRKERPALVALDVPISEDNRLEDIVPDPQAVSPLNRLLHEEAMTCIRETLAELPPLLRDALERRLAGESLLQIATAQGCSKQMAMVRERRAIEEIRRKLNRKGLL